MVDQSRPVRSPEAPTTRAASPERRLLSAVHTGLMWTLIFGLLGMEVELVLLKHTDGVWQVLPLVLLAFGFLASVWYSASKSRAAVILLSSAMALFIASGFAGTLLHFKGNVSYEQDSNPGLNGRALYEAAVQGSTPTLAPGAMIQLGLLGLIVAFCGSRLSRIDAGEGNSPNQRTEP